MTSKEALEYIEDIYEHEEGELTPYDDPIGIKIAYKEEFDILRKLVERDTPMKPKIIYREVFKKYNCSICNSTLDILGVKEVNFCPKCGQRIDWSE